MLTVLLLVGATVSFVQQLPPNLPPSNRVTDKARPDFGYMQPWAGTELTIAVVYGVECAPCDASIPFYKRLASLPGIDGKLRSFVVIADGGIAPVAGRIQNHPDKFRPSHLVSYPNDDRFGLQTSPTLLVFDRTWKRLGEWRGQLTSRQEEEVLSLVASVISKKGGTR